MNFKLLTKRSKSKEKPDKLLFLHRSNAIYTSAFSTLTTGDWLQDSIIGFYFDYLEEIFKLENSNIFLFQPSVIHLIANTSDIEDARDSLPAEIQSKDYLFLPTNNGDVFNTDGSHWSLLVYDCRNNIFRYYDSMCNSNFYSTKLMVERICKLLNKSKTNLVIEKCEQQPNDFDCGVYILIYTKMLIQRLLAQADYERLLYTSSHQSGYNEELSYSDSCEDPNRNEGLNQHIKLSNLNFSEEELWNIETLDTTSSKKRKKISKIIASFAKNNQ
ncbi:hypothetical protein BB561_002424 [Smittium simulii]|uniref:Ubiquitin-like protease family profile domain-containing protein n=1 Tax=Smittium simulii TaxID=133385 RepID=A0A2T9YQQ8_9FUNG|nr:hypothetical protein BB561_002424 [Smittium simulii]